MSDTIDVAFDDAIKELHLGPLHVYWWPIRCAAWDFHAFTPCCWVCIELWRLEITVSR